MKRTALARRRGGQRIPRAVESQASFKLIECKDGRVVFENPTHDFPQRIIYHVDKDGLLMASIEGIDKGNQKKVDFPMRRAACK